MFRQSRLKVAHTLMGTYRGRFDAGDDCIAVLTFTDGIVIDTKLLCHEVHDPALFGSQSPRERQLIPHGVILEQEDARIDLKCRWIVHVEFG